MHMACEKWDVGKLDTGDRTVLRRCAGEMMGGNMTAIEAYYHALNTYPKWDGENEIFFAAMCMECLWRADDVRSRLPMEEMLRQMYNHRDATPSTKKRIISMLDIPWGNDGFLLGKLCSMARRMRADNGGLMPDFEKLADDLRNWNHPDHFVQRRWIKVICATNNKEEEENVD